MAMIRSKDYETQHGIGSTLGYAETPHDFSEGFVAQLTERAIHALDLVNEVRGVAGRNADRLMGSEPANSAAVKDSDTPNCDIARLEAVIESLVSAAEHAGYQVNRFSKL